MALHPDAMPPHHQMRLRQRTRAGWTRLPEPLAAQILRQAFEDSGRTLRQWLNMSRVCRYDLR